MRNKADIPFYHYSETYKYVNSKDGHPALSINPNFPFVMTQFDLMSRRAQAEMPHGHDYFEIIFLEDGEEQHIIDYESYEIQRPAFYFLSKGQIHFWKLKRDHRVFPWSDHSSRTDFFKPKED
ncbi:hypothetical protein HPE56_06715 [Maribacter sp. ANRC-HE7]|uniref:AraC-type arabinose-binding/dimerisation domain-containing protein n=1 Tax=Maribacter aquimaris TaxID=2737171 RepID=A0ABR7UY81_9FLAO|nr:AraC family ligand binding domain-containing protein [Maribacter aquimaris]MBD0777478.1 hypothetical protein [Maribacter aquimaris]